MSTTVHTSGQMNAQSGFVHTAVQAASAVAQTVTGFVEEWVRRAEVYKTIRALQSLDDATLYDIGVSRGEIRRVAEEACGTRSAF